MNAVNSADRLTLYEKWGARVPAQVRGIATWHPQGSLQWVHVDFTGRYPMGKPAQYRHQAGGSTRRRDTDAAHLHANGRAAITVDTGCNQFEVSRTAFDRNRGGLVTTQAAREKYNPDDPVIKGCRCPYLIDGRIIRFDARNDTNAVVIVESKPRARHIRAEGLYVNP